MSSVSALDSKGITGIDDGFKSYNSDYQDVSELKLPKQLSHYTDKNPKDWTSIGVDVNSKVYLTPDSELTKLSSKIDLSLNKTANYRIDIQTTVPDFDFSKVEVIQRVQSWYGQAGGGWEVIYHGQIDPKAVNATITILK